MRECEVAAFFDRLAESWDAGAHNDPVLLDRILTVAGVAPGCSVLDIGCGTGVLAPSLLARGASRILGVDISPAMIARAKEKFNDPRLSFICADASVLSVIEDAQPGFDAAVVYNAYPHFPEPAALFAALFGALRPGGRVTVAHGMGRAHINAHHGGTAKAVSLCLPPAAEVAALMAPYFTADVLVDEDALYLVSGIKNA